MSSALELRKEAEERASERNNQSALSSSRLSPLRTRSERLNPVINLESASNNTPQIARIAEKDYILNGSRARAESGDFVPPRWIPDIAVLHCTNCRSEFDWVNRRHHCRHCGQIFCERCSPYKLLIPPEFGYRDPERVCLHCHEQLLPLQSYFSTNIANHQRANTIDVASDSCNVRRYMNMPLSSTLGSEIRKASYTVHNLLAPQSIKDRAIPLRLIREAKGLAFLTVIKGGFGIGGKFGTGLVISRLPKALGGGWSAPSAIGLAGLSWGFLAGADLTDYIIVLNTEDAVRAFSGQAQVTIGAELEVAVGLLGRSGSADVHIADTHALAPAFSYSQSRGLYAGVSLDGSIIMTRSEVNHCFYGRPVDAAQLLSGDLPAPRAAEPLYSALREALAAMPDVAHRVPSSAPSPVISSAIHHQQAHRPLPALPTVQRSRSVGNPYDLSDDPDDASFVHSYGRQATRPVSVDSGNRNSSRVQSLHYSAAYTGHESFAAVNPSGNANAQNIFRTAVQHQLHNSRSSAVDRELEQTTLGVGSMGGDEDQFLHSGSSAKYTFH